MAPPTACKRSRGTQQPLDKQCSVLLLLWALPALVSAAAAAAAPASAVEVKLVFEGLSQNIFEQKYANATLAAVAASAGVPVDYVTRVDKPAAPAAPAATAPAAAAPRPSSSKAPSTSTPAAAAAATAPKNSTTESTSSFNASMITSPAAAITPAAGPIKTTSSSSSSSSAGSKGARRLLATITPTATPAAEPAAAAAAATAPAAAPLAAQAEYAIRTSDTNSWATAAAVNEKLAASAAAPGYPFFSNLKRRGVPYEPNVFVQGNQILQGRPALSIGSRDAGSQSNGHNGYFGSAVTDPAAVGGSGQQDAGSAASTTPMVGPLPLAVFVPIVVLASLLGLLLLAGMGILLWKGYRAFRTCYNDEYKKQGEKQPGQFITGDAPDGEGLVKQPGGGYAPTQGALEKLNASFPTKPGSSIPAKGPESLVSNHTAATTMLSNHTAATTARSTAGLMATTDGKKNRAAKSSSADPQDAAIHYYRSLSREGKTVPILPHSRIVKPGPASIKVPVRASSTNGPVSPSQVQPEKES